jgi:hypothetical protein
MRFILLSFTSPYSLFSLSLPLYRGASESARRHEQEYAAGGELVADASGVVEQSGHGGAGGAAVGGGVADECRSGPARAWPASALRTTLSSASAAVGGRQESSSNNQPHQATKNRESQSSTSVSVVQPSMCRRLPSNNEQHDEKRQEEKVHVVCARSTSLANAGAMSAAEGGNARRTVGGRPMRRPAMVPRG